MTFRNVNSGIIGRQTENTGERLRITKSVLE